MIKPIFYFSTPKGHVVATVEHWNLRSYNSDWMNDSDFSGSCDVHDVDIIDQKWIFHTEQEALRHMARLYAHQWGLQQREDAETFGLLSSTISYHPLLKYRSLRLGQAIEDFLGEDDLEIFLLEKAGFNLLNGEGYDTLFNQVFKTIRDELRDVVANRKEEIR
jgi:hypothetical protein